MQKSMEILNDLEWRVISWYSAPKSFHAFAPLQNLKVFWVSHGCSDFSEGRLKRGEDILAGTAANGGGSV